MEAKVIAEAKKAKEEQAAAADPRPVRGRFSEAAPLEPTRLRTLNRSGQVGHDRPAAVPPRAVGTHRNMSVMGP